MNEEVDKPIWMLELGVHGPFVLQGRWPLDEVSELLPEEVLFEEIEVRAAPHGAQVVVKLHADSAYLATQLAAYYLELLLDVLSAQCHLPLQLSRQEARPFGRERYHTKRTMERQDWQQALRETHYLRLREPVFLRSLGHYRRALYSEDPIERFALLCQAIFCTLSPTQIHQTPPLEAIHRGFETLWGEQPQWPYLPYEEGGFATLYRFHKMLTTPNKALTPKELTEVCEQVETLHRLTHTFLVTWRNQQIDLPGSFYHASIQPPSGWEHLLQ